MHADIKCIYTKWLSSVAKIRARFNPHIRGQHKKMYSLPHQPGYMYGAPAEFVNLSVLLTPGQNSLSWQNPETFEQTKVGAGLVHSFATAHAMAHYQGMFLRVYIIYIYVYNIYISNGSTVSLHYSFTRNTVSEMFYWKALTYTPIHLDEWYVIVIFECDCDCDCDMGLVHVSRN